MSETPRDPRELNTQIPDDLNQIIMRCMQKEKDNRYRSAKDVLSALVNVEKDIPSTEREILKKKPRTSKEVTVQFNLKKLLVPAVAIIVLVIAAVVIWQYRNPKPEITPTPAQPSVAVLPFEDLNP